MGNHGSPGDDDVIGDLEMTDNPHHPTDLATAADFGTAGDSGISGNDRMGADPDIVPDLNQVIEFDTVFNDGIFQGPPVDAGIRTDLDPVTDPDRPKLRNALPGLTVAGETESLSPDCGTRLNLAVPSHHDIMADEHPREEPTAPAQSRPAGQVATWTDITARLDNHPILDNGLSPDAA